MKLTWETAEYLIRTLGKQSMHWPPWSETRCSSQLICVAIKARKGSEYLLDNGDKIVWDKGKRSFQLLTYLF
jgi:hypothetical protein